MNSIISLRTSTNILRIPFTSGPMSAFRTVLKTSTLKFCRTHSVAQLAVHKTECTPNRKEIITTEVKNRTSSRNWRGNGLHTPEFERPRRHCRSTKEPGSIKPRGGQIFRQRKFIQRLGFSRFVQCSLSTWYANYAMPHSTWACYVDVPFISEVFLVLIWSKNYRIWAI